MKFKAFTMRFVLWLLAAIGFILIASLVLDFIQYFHYIDKNILLFLITFEVFVFIAYFLISRFRH